MSNLYTTSLHVARLFDKQHKDVLEAIRNLHCTNTFRHLNFVDGVYVTTQNKRQPLYRLTKKGFLYLTVGFIGPRAGLIKELVLDNNESRFNLSLRVFADVFGLDYQTLSEHVAEVTNKNLWVYEPTFGDYILTSDGVCELIRVS